jgi:hypothetical protein
MNRNVLTKPVNCNPLRIYLCKNKTTRHYEKPLVSGYDYVHISLYATEHPVDETVRWVILSRKARANLRLPNRSDSFWNMHQGV